MLMQHPEHGWHNASDLEKDEMKKNGWLESSEEERQKLIAAKVGKGVIIATQDAPTRGKPGRKPKLFLGGSYGDSTDNH